MSRRPRDPAAHAAAHAGGSRELTMDEFVGRAPRKARGVRSASRAQVDRALEEAEAMRASGDWSKATSSHLVALYGQLHRHVYGAWPSELAGRVWTSAVLACARMVDKEFGGDVRRAVEFVAWSWRREKRAHARGNPDRRRMGWRLQFSPALVTDYRVHLAQQRDRGPVAAE